MPAQAALEEVFRHVRARIPRLGIGEYVALLRALEAGFGAGPRELTFLCQTLWAKSPTEQRQVAQLVAALLPDLDAPAPAPAPAPLPSEPSVAPAPLPQPEPERRPSASAEPVPSGAAEGVADQGGVRVAVDVPRELRRALRELPLTSTFDLQGTLPVSRRQMSRAWRFYRRMGRRGAPVEVDAEATVRRIYRDGVLAKPVLVPRRTNQAQALILEDTGGSMVPFRHVTAELVEAARHAGLGRVEVRYFHDVPVDVVFRDPSLMAPVMLNDAAAPFADAGILVYSDAGAARGGMDRERVRRTARLLETLWRATPNMAWLNPVPEERWRGTTAEAIRGETGVPMFPLDLRGLQSAVNHMRGAR